MSLQRDEGAPYFLSVARAILNGDGEIEIFCESTFPQGNLYKGIVGDTGRFLGWRLSLGIK